MKKFLAILIIISMTLCGCTKSHCNTSKTPDSSMDEIIVPLKMPDININIPDKFKKSSTEINETVFICNDASVIINSDKLPENVKTSDDYADYAIKHYTDMTDSLKVISRSVVNSDSGTKITQVEFTYSVSTNNGKLTKTCIAGYFVDSDTIYMITCKSDNNTYQSFKSDFLGIIKSAGLK